MLRIAAFLVLVLLPISVTANEDNWGKGHVNTCYDLKSELSKNIGSLHAPVRTKSLVDKLRRSRSEMILWCIISCSYPDIHYAHLDIHYKLDLDGHWMIMCR